MTCDDGDACTTGETYDANCNCTGGILIDSDNNGICDLDENDCPMLEFNANTVFQYDPGQDFGPATFLDGGATVYMEGNAWKAMEINYNFTPNTVIEFDFKSTAQGEIHEVGFDNDLIVAPNHRLVVYGNQGYFGTFNNPFYDGSGNYTHYTVKPAFTGFFKYLVLTADDDVDGSGNSYYSNFTIYEDVNGNMICDDAGLCTPGTACDDGNDCTINDVLDADCNCAGTFQDSDADGVCDAEDVCDGGDDTIDADGNGIPDDCDGEFCYYTTLDDENFEGGWGIWNDGGSDSRRSSSDANFAASGNYCVRLRDNTNSSVMTTDNLDMSSFDEVTIEFTYVPYSMDNATEDFWLQVSLDGGASYITVEEWNLGDEFQNNFIYSTAVTLVGTFSTDTKFRFRCDASSNYDYVFIDDVIISGCSIDPNITLADVLNQGAGNRLGDETSLVADIDAEDITMYPNPARNFVNVFIPDDIIEEEQNDLIVNVYALDGKLIMSQSFGPTTTIRLDVNDLTAKQMYVIRVETPYRNLYTGKFIKE